MPKLLSTSFNHHFHKNPNPTNHFLFLDVLSCPTSAHQFARLPRHMAPNEARCTGHQRGLAACQSHFLTDCTGAGRCSIFWRYFGWCLWCVAVSRKPAVNMGSPKGVPWISMPIVVGQRGNSWTKKAPFWSCSAGWVKWLGLGFQRVRQNKVPYIQLINHQCPYLDSKILASPIFRGTRVMLSWLHQVVFRIPVTNATLIINANELLEPENINSMIV